MTHHPKVKAVGEIGLDYYWQEVPRDLQKEVFRAQLALAQRLDMPVIVHDREAHGDSLAIVKEFPGVRGGFIHVPYAMEQVVNKPLGTPSMDLHQIARGLEKAVEAIVESDSDIAVNMGTTH